MHTTHCTDVLSFSNQVRRNTILEDSYRQVLMITYFSSQNAHFSRGGARVLYPFVSGSLHTIQQGGHLEDQALDRV